MHNRRVQPSRADLRAEITARELEQEDSMSTRPVYRGLPPINFDWSPDGYYGYAEPNL